MPSLANRLPGLNFDLGETADMLRTSVEAFAADRGMAGDENER